MNHGSGDMCPTSIAYRLSLLFPLYSLNHCKIISRPKTFLDLLKSKIYILVV